MPSSLVKYSIQVLNADRFKGKNFEGNHFLNNENSLAQMQCCKTSNNHIFINYVLFVWMRYSLAMVRSNNIYYTLIESNKLFQLDVD